MANVLTDLAADIYKSADTVGREIVGAIPSVTINSGSEGAAIGQAVKSHFTSEATVNDIVPSMTIPEGDDQTVTNKELTLTKQKAVQIPWTGEDIKYVNGGSGFTNIYGDQLVQAMRKIVNLIEVDLCDEIYKNASRSVGTPGTTPFASNFDIIAEGRQIIVDNGQSADDGQLSMVLNTLAGTKLRNLAQLQKANEAGGDQLLRQGTLLDLQGVMLKESAGVQSHTKGTGTSYLLSAAAAVGDTTISVDTGSGTIVAGDVLTIGNHDYVVGTALTGGDIVLNAPGIVEAAADNATVTVKNNRTANFIVHRGAAELALRAPAVPLGGDAAVDVMNVRDPHSGLVFQVSAYKGYKKAMFEVAAVWGQKAWKDEGIVDIAG